MAGQMKYTAANTTAPKTSDAKLTKAHAEGRKAGIAGVNTNPHISGSPCALAWTAGHDTTTPEGLVDSAAQNIPIAVPNVVGMTLAAATTALNAVTLVVGAITGTTGNITVQNPAAAAKVQRNTTVALTRA